LFFFTFIASYSQCRIIEDGILALTRIETNSSAVSFEYNQWGWVTSETRSGVGSGYLNYKFEYEYDGNGNRVQLILNDPYFVRKECNEYSLDNQIMEKNIYEDYGKDFQYIGQYSYTYQDGLLQTILMQINSSTGLRNNIKKEFSYNKERQLVQITKHDWIFTYWLHTETYNFEYNDFGDILYYSLEMIESEAPVKFWRYCFSYNEERELTERSLYYAVGSGWSTRPNNRYIYHYDTLLEDETILFPDIYNFDELNFNCFPSTKKIKKHDFWLLDCGGSLNFIESAEYSYRPININSEVAHYEQENILVYPNPTTGELFLRLRSAPDGEWRIKNIKIFDVMGKSVHSSLPANLSTTIIDISNLNSGIYYVKVFTEQGDVVKKIVKQ